MVEGILACTPDGVIGYGSGIPWHHSGDFKRFKQITMGKTLVIGYRTLIGLASSFKKAVELLPGRRLVVVGHEKDCSTDIERELLEEEFSLELFKKINYDTMAHITDDRIFGFIPSNNANVDLIRITARFKEDLVICGGAQVYERYLPCTNMIYLTLIQGAIMPDSELVWLLPESQKLLGIKGGHFYEDGRNAVGTEIENGIVATYYECDQT